MVSLQSELKRGSNCSTKSSSEWSFNFHLSFRFIMKVFHVLFQQLFFKLVQFQALYSMQVITLESPIVKALTNSTCDTFSSWNSTKNGNECTNFWSLRKPPIVYQIWEIFWTVDKNVKSLLVSANWSCT